MSDYTKAELEAKVERLNELLKKELILDTWSPGDGWTRYRLRTPSGSYFAGWNYQKQEMGRALDLAIETAYAMLERDRV